MRDFSYQALPISSRCWELCSLSIALEIGICSVDVVSFSTSTYTVWLPWKVNSSTNK